MMAGFYTYIRTALICYLAGFVVFMKHVPGSVESIPMTIANTMCGLKMQLNSGSLHINSWKITAAAALRSGNIASNSMNKLCQGNLISLGSIIALVLISMNISAQDVTLESRIQSAIESLSTLDKQAKSCLDLLEQEVTEQAPNSCNLFIQHIDGALLASYLANCEVLKGWREEFVTREVNIPENIKANLELMRGVEFACGEGALQKRTEFVVITFNSLQGRNAASKTTIAVDRRMTELEFEQTINAERRLLQNGMLEQRQHTNLQIERQWDEQREELIRQQISRPRFPSN